MRTTARMLPVTMVEEGEGGVAGRGEAEEDVWQRRSWEK